MKKESISCFQIGEQYEKWEFDLDILPIRIKGYDSYKYIGLNNNIKHSKFEYELIFNLDVLEAVVIIIQTNNMNQIEKLYTLCKNSNYKVIKAQNRLIVIYGKEHLVSSVYANLLQ